jgi:hypothetical protein
VLVDGCLSFLSADVCVRPNYGWGWRRDGVPLEPTDYSFIDATDFTVRVDRFFRFEGQLRGIVGVVTTRPHPFAGSCIVAAEMLVGEHDFVERLCQRYDLTLGARPPTVEEWPQFEGPGIVGFT